MREQIEYDENGRPIRRITTRHRFGLLGALGVFLVFVGIAHDPILIVPTILIIGGLAAHAARRRGARTVR